MSNALDLIDEAIADLEAKLNLPPGGSLPTSHHSTLKTKTVVSKDSVEGKKGITKKEPKKKKKPSPEVSSSSKKKGAVANVDQPDICKLEFKVGKITKVWAHPDADRLYCEQIDCGEETPREIASGLREHYTEEEMMGRRLLVVSNLKAKKLVGFKSHGMVLCATKEMDGGGGEIVEFIEPPEDAPPGEVVTFEGLPTPEPFSGAQVEKKKVFQACLAGMKTTGDCVAAWEGHAFLTSKGPCRSRTVKDGVMR